MSRSAGRHRDESTDTRSGVWKVVSWTWPARARVLLAIVVLISGVTLRLASDSLGTGRQRACRVVPVLVIDPNTAPASVLEALPHVGPSLVKQLIEQRERHPFESFEDMHRRVRGLGPVMMARLSPYLRIAASSDSSTRPKSLGSRAGETGPGAEVFCSFTVAAPRRWHRGHRWPGECSASALHWGRWFMIQVKLPWTRVK